jgi:hypothetical protein
MWSSPSGTGWPRASSSRSRAGIPSTGVKRFIDHTVTAGRAAGGTLATLQDSPMLLEVGDVELRKGLTEVRELIDEITPRARELVRRLGR